MKSKFGIVKKMVIGITAVSAVTYATSAFFLLVLKDMFDFMSGWLFVLLTLLLGIFWTGLFGFFAAKWLLKPLVSLTDAAREAAKGNLRANVSPPASGDEMQELGEAFDKMLAQLREMIDGIKENTRLTDSHVRELQEAVGQATGQIEQMTNESEAITSGTQTQAESAERLHLDAETLSAAADRMSDEAAVARERVTQMNRAAAQSEEVFKSLIGGMRQLSELNREAMDVVEKLSDYAKQIGTISDVVGDIADQTHLLALNASIEAARAGEEGRGFEVVAQAVKSLADESAGSVKNIRTLIRHIQEEVGRAVGHIRSQYELSEREAEGGQKFAAAFHDVNEEAQQVVGLVESMAAGISRQAEQATMQLNEARRVATVADRIRLGAQQVFSASQEQTAVMQEIAASTDSLRAKSAELRTKTEFFRS
ncbi:MULTISPECIES: methyl-accepting chemotaxis protein [Cohnella]|uniref:Methyl-accepting chemotaxis protein n=1 Tax=Cohnella phaseoli TaxID=456490 RepID=A0A3D9KSC8_9BACL|nr:methyl-accepting chemotaxis protein [Cohnella phaseoli]RED89304.1 methyl-accepting chemotaxis protein [Cohnella phaseoli]